MILAADIGGTKTLLALAHARRPQPPHIVFEQRYASRDFADFAAVLQRFAGEAADAGHAMAQLDAACFGVAGPVRGRRAQLTNLPWQIDADEMARGLGGTTVHLVNDFAAVAAGTITPNASAALCLQAGSELSTAPRAIVGAGTGLGVAALIPGDGGSNKAWTVLPGEGGHIGFAPADTQQAALWQWLHARDPRVSCERLLSGRGLADIYRWTLEYEGASDEAALLTSADPASAISAHAARWPASPAARAIDAFCAVYGAFAGDMALLYGARGGVYVAGGIAAHLRPILPASRFLECFRAKGVHAGLMPEFPVHIVTETRLGLLGALALADAGVARIA